MQYTATNAASQVVASAQGSFAEALQLVEEWNSKIAEGDDLCNLRIKMLAVLQEETAEFLFGPADARKLSEVVRNEFTENIFSVIFFQISIF